MLKYVLNRDGSEKGTVINERSRKCRLEGCRHWRVSVRWANGKITYPCWGGLKTIDDETTQIE